MSDEVFSLESFQKAAEKKYGTQLAIGLPDGDRKTNLHSPFKLSDEKRKKAMSLMDEINAAAQNSEGEEDSEEVSTDAFEAQIPQIREFLLAVGDGNTPELVEALQEDLGTLLEIFTTYQSEVKLGEAQDSSES